GLNQFALGWCKPWCKLFGCSICPCCRGTFPVGPVEGKFRQHVKSTANVQQPWVGVNAHRQVDLAVTHCCLSRSRGHPAFAHQGPESVPQGVNVNRPTPFVSLLNANLAIRPLDPAGYTSHYQVTVENLRQLVWHIEDLGIWRQTQRSG